MGSTPSKEETHEHKIIANNHSKDDSQASETVQSSSDNNDESMHEPSQDRRKQMVESAMSATPRTKPTKKNGFEAQNRVNRQLGMSDRRDDNSTQAQITDDQVHVNLAMADLMAYLQVVANNSNNLPLTRRDDPELTRMVTSLTSEEYARKSAAFIPADVRMIGATFTKYGRVWDLPTSEEYNASDGAQEPGCSYGGACCNSMLKVLYDAANDAVDAAQTMEAAALFDDDEDEEESLSNLVGFDRNSTFASLDMNDHSNPSTLTWASLLRKMKAETKDIEYPQVPMLSATRKFDLNQPFSLVPDNFDNKTGKKRSLLIGCNYHHINGAQLKASHDDVRSMKDYIVNVHGYPENDELMTILLDDDEHKHPTFHNITEAFKALSEQSQPGDAVFIQFSGHGGRVLDSRKDQDAESYDEIVVPSDYATSGLIRDTLMFKTLLAPMRYGVTVTILVDCCDTGMVLDLPYAWTTRSDKPGSIVKMTQNDDFSFVRFLKVVKTLYESSTFTQLGKTVGSALHQPGGHRRGDEDDAGNYTDTSRGEDDDQTRSITQAPAQSSLMNLFGVCTSPPDEMIEEEPSSKSARKQHDDRDVATVDTRDTKGPSSLLEQMMNCTLGQGEEASDEDTYKSRGSYDDNTLGDSTFDSMTDEDEEGKRRGRSRRRSRRD